MPQGPAHLRLCPAPSESSAPDGPLDLDELYRHYGRYVAAVALHILGRRDDVDDVVQEVFLGALKGIAAVRNADAIRGWLRTITVRTASARLRQRRLFALLGLDRAPRYDDLVAPDA